MVTHYKVLARFQPFNSKEEFITLRSETFFEDIVTLCVDDDLVMEANLSEGDIVTMDQKTIIKKVE